MDLHATFGFHKTPFTREVAADEMLALPHIEQARDAVVTQLERRMSAAVIAPAGAGKSALLRALRARLPQARYRVHYVKVTDLGKRDFCREIASCVGVRPAGSYPMLVRRLQEDFAEAGTDSGVRPVLFVDDAHDIRFHVLNVLRVITNFDYDSRLVLSVVLAGQPPLERMLKRASLEDVAQRIAHYARLRLLSRDETARYVEHRCTVAGASTTPFDRSAIDAVFEMSRGNLRAVDRLCLASLDVTAQRDAATVAASDVAAARKHLWP
jgi:type II secretory pathway predicted ATPase ExeA